MKTVDTSETMVNISTWHINPEDQNLKYIMYTYTESTYVNFTYRELI
jgi:hypothetical protein